MGPGKEENKTFGGTIEIWARTKAVEEEGDWLDVHCPKFTQKQRFS